MILHVWRRLRQVIRSKPACSRKVHSSAFSRTSAVQIENLAKILRDILQKLNHTLGGPPYNLSLKDRPFLRFTTRCPWKLPPNVSPVDKRRSQPPGRCGTRRFTEENLIDGNATQQFEVVEKLSGA